MLLGRGPVFWVTDHIYLLVAVITSLMTFVWVRVYSVPKRGIILSDALGLAVFAVIGTEIALNTTNSGSVAIIMGTMTGVAGGMIRDVLSAEIPLILRSEIYATAALCGALTYVVMRILALPDDACIIISLLTTLSIRIAAIHWRLSLPLFLIRKDIDVVDPN